MPFSIADLSALERYKLFPLLRDSPTLGAMISDVATEPTTVSPLGSAPAIRLPVNTSGRSLLEPYAESPELMLCSREVRVRAWEAWNEKRKKLRRFAFDRLRDALALNWTGTIDIWKQRVIVLGPEDRMPPFDDTEDEAMPVTPS